MEKFFEFFSSIFSTKTVLRLAYVTVTVEYGFISNSPWIFLSHHAEKFHYDCRIWLYFKFCSDPFITPRRKTTTLFFFLKIHYFGKFVFFFRIWSDQPVRHAQQRAILVFIRKVFDILKRSEINVIFYRFFCLNNCRLLLDYAVKKRGRSNLLVFRFRDSSVFEIIKKFSSKLTFQLLFCFSILYAFKSFTFLSVDNCH